MGAFAKPNPTPPCTHLPLLTDLAGYMALRIGDTAPDFEANTTKVNHSFKVATPITETARSPCTHSQRARQFDACYLDALQLLCSASRQVLYMMLCTCCSALHHDYTTQCLL